MTEVEPISKEEVEELLRGIPGILDAHVEMAAQGEIQGVHLVSEPDRQTQEVIRRVEETLTAPLGIFLDPRRVSVTYRAEEEEELPARARLVLEQVEVTRDLQRNRLVVEVGARRGGAPLRGRSEGSLTGRREAWLAAAATAEVLNQMCEPEAAVILDAFKVVAMGEDEVALARLAVRDRTGREEFLVGSAGMGGDQLEAAARAVLAAANRRLGWRSH
ncbi:MAG: hypothetical protein M0031_01865 [Thermaerobacter sp.]|jgi:hypothetical protein|nr:hypothetical protein [Thermaerobacter sp.]